MEDEFMKHKYNLISSLGRGGYGQVNLYQDKKTNSKVDIKFIDLLVLGEHGRNKVFTGKPIII